MSSARAARFALCIPMVCFCMVFASASPRAESAGPVSYDKFDKTTYLVDRATALPDCGTTPDELPCRLQSFFACKVRRDPALCETLGIRMDRAGRDFVFGIEDFAGSPELIEVEFRAQWVRRLYDQTFASRSWSNIAGTMARPAIGLKTASPFGARHRAGGWLRGTTGSAAAVTATLGCIIPQFGSRSASAVGRFTRPASHPGSRIETDIPIRATNQCFASAGQSASTIHLPDNHT